MNRRSVLLRALIFGISLSQAACSVCRIQSEESVQTNARPANPAPPLDAKSRHKPSRKTERVELSLPDQTKLNAVLSFPEKFRAPLPVLIILGGFETGEKVVDLLRSDLDMIFATVDYPYKAPNERGLSKDLNEISVITKAVRRTDLAVDALIERLRADPRVNLSRMTFVGASFGAPFAITAAVRNPEIDGLILIHAFGRVDLAITRQLVAKWGAWTCPVACFLGKLAWAKLDYKAPEDEVLKLHRHQKVFFIYSDADEQLPAESIESLQEALMKSQAQVSTAKSLGGHLGPGKTEMIDELMDMSIEWLKAHRLR